MIIAVMQQLKELQIVPISGLNGIRTHDLCDSGANATRLFYCGFYQYPGNDEYGIMHISKEIHRSWQQLKELQLGSEKKNRPRRDLNS